MEWTEERIEELKQWHDQGYSASVMAAHFGTTRNAILGKVFRLGLSRPMKRKSEEEKAVTRRKYLVRQYVARAAKRQKAREIRMEEIEIAKQPHPDAMRIPLMDLPDFRADGPNRCRYIADEPAGPDYLACGLFTDVGKSYCPHCTRIVTRNGFELSEVDQMKKRAHYIRIGNASKIGRTLDIGDAA